MITAAIDDNLDRIRSDLVRLGLTYDRLMDDLLDHVCCLVEDKMKTGDDFESSYSHVLETIGEKSIPEIQHQTLLNLDKKFQRMKNFTYFFGLTSALLTIIGAFFKRMHWPGAGILLTVGIGLIVLVFLPLFFIMLQKEQTEKKHPIYAIVGFLTIELLLASALFKIMHWPGAGMMIQVGVGFLIIGFIPLYVVNAFQRGGKEKVRLPYIVMLLVGIGLVMLISNVRMSKYRLDVYLQETTANEYNLEEIRGRTAKLIEKAGDSLHVDKKEHVMRIHDQARDLQVIIGDMKEALLEAVDQPGIPIGDVKGKDVRKRRLGDRDAYEWETEIIREALKFREMLDEMLLDPVIRTQIEDHLAFTRKVWPYHYGTSVSGGEVLMVNYYKISEAAKDIALSEYVAINYLLTH